MAEELQLDILPIVLYGNGLVSSKKQPFYIKRGHLVSKILPRISPTDSSYGVGYRERTKLISKYFKAEYQQVYETYNRVSNPYFKEAIIKNYIYKGPVLEWYMRVKLKMEQWYDGYDRLLPRQGTIVDLGCGYGAMSYMLSMLSDRRVVFGVDYDQEKIALANNCFLKNERISFAHADLRNYELPCADAFIISDVLHYMDRSYQDALISQCIDKLNPGGMLLVRDGDSSQKEKHNHTINSEKWSTKIVKFNKTDGPLCFLNQEQLSAIAQTKGVTMEVVSCDATNSNTLFKFTKPTL